MSETAYELIAKTRINGMATRLGLAVLACITATLLHPSFLPVVWLGVYALGQVVDRTLFLESLRPSQKPRSEAPTLISLVVNVLIFSSLAVYNFCDGGVEGRIFGAITICCSLMSVTFSLYPMKRYLYAALIPHALYLLSLPVIGLLTLPAKDEMAWGVVTVSIVTYLVYLMIAARQLNGSMLALKDARDEAQAARQLAEDANAAKSNFLAVITHEIRTPMNAVVSAVNLLERTDLSDGQRAHLSMLGQASDMLLGLLNDVLDLSKIEVGKLQIAWAQVDVAEMLRNLEAMFLPQAQLKGLSLKITVAPDVASHIMADPLRLRQILFNLVANAVKFTDAGTVRLRVWCVHLAGVETQLLFTVEDQGIGIAADQLERIFSSFAQAEAATTRRYGGTGLGLSISRQLARLMGGDITVTSALGAGSTFSLRLKYDPASQTPACLEPEAEPAEETTAAPVAHHVLIVDDHEINRRIVSLLIEPHGWTWTMAANGAEALEHCHDQAFDVILMDMQMPVMDGITATRCIRAMRGSNALTPIVALTANAMDHHRKLWADVGVEDFLTKPIDPDLLVTTLNERAALGRIELPPADAPAISA